MVAATCAPTHTSATNAEHTMPGGWQCFLVLTPKRYMQRNGSGYTSAPPATFLAVFPSHTEVAHAKHK
eukprot:43753-Pelagomonas_calceolata.AAC.1